MTINQIEQWEQKNPDDIDEMPVQADIFYGRVVFRRKAAAQRFFDEPYEQACADEHVQGVEAGHAKVQREEKLGMGVGAGVGARLELEIPAGDVVLNIFVVILDGLDAKKDRAEDQSAMRNQVSAFFLPACDAQTAMAIVKLLPMRTTVLIAPQESLMVLLASLKMSG